MSILINRKYSSRIECLYYILKTIYRNYDKSEFIISDIKYDPEMDYNVFDYCQLKKCNFGRDYCPFLDNPLNKSKCYATQSVMSDTTKAKAASATVRSLEALGLVDSTGRNNFQVSTLGEELCNLDFNSKEWFELIQRSVLSYGPINAYILRAQEMGDTFNSSKLFISYPNTQEPIDLSIGSTKDSNTRTVSMLTSWCLTAGLIELPNDRNYDKDLPQIYYKDVVNSPRLSNRKFVLTDFSHRYIKSNPLVRNPLSYSSLNKNVGSLRERNSSDIRNNTLKYNHIILNRRFAIIYILNSYYTKDDNITFEILHDMLVNHESSFFLPNSDTWDIIQSEINICPLAGLMIKSSPDKIIVLNQVDLNILSEDAPKELVDLCEDIVGDI